MRGFGKFWKMLGSTSDKNHERGQKLVEASSTHDSWAQDLSDEDYPEVAHELDLLSEDTEDLPKFLALVREGAERSIGLRPFDVQLEGALRILEGDIVEMATGEGKTLSGAIAAVGYALQGHRIHVISVNDYLARRDAEWMGPLFRLFGLSVGWLSESSTREERRDIYQGDVTYASVNEIGFDVLRDQLGTRSADLVSPEPDVAIVDEADSVLVDEALVPLVLAGSSEGEVPRDSVIEVIRKLRKRRHYETDSEMRNIFLTEEGARFVEEELGGISLYDTEHVSTTLVQVNVALHAHVLLRRDVHYIVRDDKVQLIDASRGRVAELQRWPDGLQAAVEAKEGVQVSQAGEILDSMTVQGFIGRYKTVSGMTGTALAAGEQFRRFYGLSVSVIAPNTPCIRDDEPDRVYDTIANKQKAIVDFIKEIHETKQPILIGTQDVEESEELATQLEEQGLSVRVLNAKNDAEEAGIVAEAGVLGTITVSTQMAGRGTDIRLGGSDEKDKDAVVEAGGLAVIGTSRYTTERLDYQLRGRAGRQGDPGRAIFFSSMQDDVIAAGAPDAKWPGETDRQGQFLKKKAEQLVDHAQRVTEGQMLQIHAHTWRFSQLVADQRTIVEEGRRRILTDTLASEKFRKHNPERWAKLKEAIPAEVLDQAARDIMLYFLDRGWSEHLSYLDDVRESIHLRALGRQNPLDEYHRLAISAFAGLAESSEAKANEAFDELEITEAGVDLGLAGLVRPTSTWTYMIHNNPLSSGEGGFSSLGGVFR